MMQHARAGAHDVDHAGCREPGGAFSSATWRDGQFQCAREIPLIAPAEALAAESTVMVVDIGVWSSQVAIPRAEIVKLARAHSALILELATGAIWIHRDRSVAWLVEIIPAMAANDRAEEPVFFAPGVSFSFPLALVAGNRESLEKALRRDIELAHAVATGEVLVDGGDAAPLVRLARQLVAAPTAWKATERRLKAGHATQSSRRERAIATTAPPVATELDTLIERQRRLEQSIQRARVVLASAPNAQLESVCSQATRALLDVRAQMAAEPAPPSSNDGQHASPCSTLTRARSG